LTTGELAYVLVGGDAEADRASPVAAHGAAAAWAACDLHPGGPPRPRGGRVDALGAHELPVLLDDHREGLRASLVAAILAIELFETRAAWLPLRVGHGERGLAVAMVRLASPSRDVALAPSTLPPRLRAVRSLSAPAVRLGAGEQLVEFS
jgi:hypothetical protein